MQVVVSQLAHRTTPTEFCYYLLLLVQKYRTYPAESIVLQITTIRSLHENIRTIITQTFQWFYVAFSLQSILEPFTLIYRYSIHEQRSSPMSQPILHFSLKSSTISKQHLSSTPSSSPSFILEVLWNLIYMILFKGLFELEQKLPKLCFSSKINNSLGSVIEMIPLRLIAFLYHSRSHLYFLFRSRCLNGFATRMRSLTGLLSFLHILNWFAGRHLKFWWRLSLEAMVGLCLVRLLFGEKRSWSL